ncbi:MAG TPA: protein kinase, partial [Legionellaceae bacterium]|nr:protein kinase [Legionellaceae bacterium]
VAALLNLANNSENKAAIAQAGAIEPLIELLSDKNTKIRYHSARMLQYLIVAAENKATIARAGAIEPLIRLLSDSDTKIRKYAVGALMSLAISSKNRIPIAQAGAIEPLIRLFSDSDTTIRQYAVGALLNLAINSKNQTIIAQSNTIGPLIRLFFDSNTVTRQYAVRALMNLADHSENKITIIQAGAIQPLIRLSSDNDTQICHYASKALKNLDVTLELEHQNNNPSSSTASASSFNMQVIQQSLPSIPEEPVTLQEELGQGTFGEVYKGLYKEQTVAVKYFNHPKTPVTNEIAVMLQMQHQCIVRIFEVVLSDNTSSFLVMEYGAQGSLKDYLHNHTDLPWSLRLQIAEELARGLAHLHEMHVIHRNIKSSNVVLDNDLHSKWCDFGSDILLSGTAMISTENHNVAENVRWMAPELLQSDTSVFDTASDIWALAMVFFELDARKIPYHELDSQQAKNKIVQYQTEAISEECQRQAPGFAALIQRCWAERSLRPKASVVENEMRQVIII